jgi:hypothetical protein
MMATSSLSDVLDNTSIGNVLLTVNGILRTWNFASKSTQQNQGLKLGTTVVSTSGMIIAHVGGISAAGGCAASRFYHALSRGASGLTDSQGAMGLSVCQA